jgi:hypothetical protein
VDLLLESLTLTGVYVGIGIAVLRYRLYEIDRLINRTLVYGLLTAVLGLCFAGGSPVFVLVAGAGTDPPGCLVAAATLAAAAVFRPARRRIQAVVSPIPRTLGLLIRSSRHGLVSTGLTE